MNSNDSMPANTFTRQLRFELSLTLRRPSDWLMTWVFFALVVSLFPLGIGAETELLRRMAAGVLWVAALLATLLVLPRLLEDDWRDGSLEQLALQPAPLALLLGAKALAHWLCNALSLCLLSPLLGLQLGLQADEIGVLLISLLLGSPALSALGLVGAALTVGLRSAAVLLTLLLLPLYIPVLIFGSLALDVYTAGGSPAAHWSLLAALSLASAALSPFAASAAVRIALD